MRKAENLAQISQIPKDRILVETDAPWCSIKASHASHPILVEAFEEQDEGLEVVAAVKNLKSVKANNVRSQGIVEDLEKEYLVKDRCEPLEVIKVVLVLSKIYGVSLKQMGLILEDNLTVFLSQNGQNKNK